MARHKDAPSVYFPAAHWLHRPCIDWDKVAELAETEIPFDCQRRIDEALWVLTSWLKAENRRLESRDLQATIAKLDLIAETPVVLGLEESVKALRDRLTDWIDAKGEGPNIWYRQIGKVMLELQRAGVEIVTTEPNVNSKSVPVCRKLIGCFLRWHTGAQLSNEMVDKRRLSGDEAVENEISKRHLLTDKALAKAMNRAWETVPQEFSN
jgi:hypothetical protein